MLSLQSTKVDFPKPPQEVFLFLSDMNNFRLLMPEDKISGWSSDKAHCSFEITGLSKIAMEKEGETPFSEVRIIGRKPFDFKLHVHIIPYGQGSESQLTFTADVNPFMKMMLEKPLGNFFNSLAQKLGEIMQ